MGETHILCEDLPVIYMTWGFEMNILRNRNSGNEMLSVRLCLVDVECQINLLLETMSTMVATPYVNHVATMTGGVGFEHLARFYKVPLDNNHLQN